jgi:hypothetical protein
MKDRDGNTLKAGDRFIYQVGEPHECEGELFSLGGVEVIKWDDNAIISVSDFYHQPTDQKILQRL